MYEIYNVDANLWTFKHKAAIDRVSSLWTLLDSMIITSRMAVVRAYRLLLFPNVLLIETHQSYHLTYPKYRQILQFSTNLAHLILMTRPRTYLTKSEEHGLKEDFILPAQVRASPFFHWSSS